MIDQDFCDFLEYKICSAFELSDNDQIKGFWCDGVVLDQADSYYSQKWVNDKRYVILKAFIGKGGQTAYELTLKFGNKALSRFAKNLDLKECVPNLENNRRFVIDNQLNKMEIHLD